jgi:hypothetical protein
MHVGLSAGSWKQMTPNFLVNFYEHAQLEELTVTFGLATYKISAMAFVALNFLNC